MPDSQMMTQMRDKPGFIAALDQSGGSTPKALAAYGIAEDTYQGDAAMFQLVHDMRVRIVTAPSFSGARVLAAILFERTMDGDVHGQPVPTFLWKEKGVVPFLKVDKGLEDEKDGVQLMKPMPGLDDLLARAAGLGVFGTKMRAVVNRASRTGIAAIVDQQFAVAEQIAAQGLMPMLEPEALLKSDEREAAENILLDELKKGLDALPADRSVMLKLSIPVKPDLYAPLIAHPRVMRVVALSGGYSRDKACQELAKNHGMIASFSRALVEDLRHQMSDAEFDAALGSAIEQIYQASAIKV